MQIRLEAGGQSNLVRSHAPGRIEIGEVVAVSPLLVSARTLRLDVGIASASALSIEDCAALLALDPELILIGTPTLGARPAAAVRAHLGARRIGLEVMEIGAACRTYNVLVQEERRVIALLFP